MVESLRNIIAKDRVKTRLIDRYAYASDASHYYLVPLAVVQPNTIEEIQNLFVFSQLEHIPITFRAAGTSLSGQALSDGILVVLSNYWRQVIPENNGKLVRIQPGIIGSHVNIALKKYRRKIGPDPASINAAMMGGILSNNASGMCCGVEHNSYHTLKYIKFVLPNGLVFNTEITEDYPRFENEAAKIHQGIQDLKAELRANIPLVDTIRKKYKQKNTVGYGLNAFLDYEHPLDILAHLIIGAEGTLAFIAEAVLETLPDLPYKSTAMLYFENPSKACNTLTDLIKTGAVALEFMDRASLRSVEHLPDVPSLLKDLPPEATAILCEFQENTAVELAEKFANAATIIAQLPLLHQPVFTQDPKEQAKLWKIRKGMYPSVAGLRAKGTSALLEDFTFPVERLGEAVIDVQRLFEVYGYQNGIIFGHAKDGNLHFVISLSFDSQVAINNYEKFNEALFQLVLNKYGGALKAEHGTGRAVSAFVEIEWGPAAYAIMQKLKSLIDPHKLLNPDIIITENKQSYLQNLKILPLVDEEVDKCIECGFCESVCPSRDLTLSPRRRIGIRRALKRLETTGDSKAQATLIKDFVYEGIETCAVDGMCATTCPVDINTGELVKRLRQENHSIFENKMALFVAKNFILLENTVRFALKTGFLLNNTFGVNTMTHLTGFIRKIVPAMPLWSAQISSPPRFLSNNTSIENPAVVYFSTCISRMMGGDIFDLFSTVCTKANISLISPPSIKGTCCGQIFSSKGFTVAYDFTANQSIEKLWEYSQAGKIEIVLDITSCTQTIKNSRSSLNTINQARFDKMRFVDMIDFAADTILPNLKITNKKDNIVFHPVCSAYKMGLLPKLQQIGTACATAAHIPEKVNCCGMAGDRGFYYPELIHAATKAEAEEVNEVQYDGYYSSSKTCEMALSEAVGKNYKSILKLLDEVSVI